MDINDETFKTIRKSKGAEILGSLADEAKLVSELQAQIGGSMSTIYERIEEFQSLGIVEKVPLDRAEFGYLPANAKLLRLTDEGKPVVRDLSQIGLVRSPVLSKQRQRWILLHLFKLGEIRGRTRFEKLLYLQKDELRFTEGNFYSFKWEHYGPFSKNLLDDLEDLVDKGLITEEIMRIARKSDVANLYIYALTADGRELIPRILDELPSRTLEELESLRVFNEMPLVKLLSYVYERSG
ncbi:MAG: hypothetical protein V3U09_00480 [Thermoplasmata archaeon]